MERRNFLARAGGVLLGVVAAQLVLSPPVAAQQRVTLLSRRVSQVPLDPEAAEWQQANPLSVSLSSQVVVKPRLYEASVKEITVRSLYDEERLGLLLEWQNKSQETGLGRVTGYRDAVAVQFPADPSRPNPYFAMGEPNNPVTIYHWKADWQFGPLYDANEAFPNMAWDHYPLSGKPPGQIAEATDYAPPQGDRAFIAAWHAGNPLANPEAKKKSPVEKLSASGFGSLTSGEEQDGQGKGVWKDGRWRVALSLPRKQGDFEFSPGTTLPVAYAAWDGANRERGAEKAISSWYFLALEKPAPVSRFILPVVVAGGVAALEWLLVRRLRRSPSGK